MSQRGEEAGRETPGKRPAGSPDPTREAEPYRESRCPRCGGRPRRVWMGVCAGAVATFFAFLMMAPIGLSMHSMAGLIVFLVSAGLAIVSLIAIPISGALVVASRSCCCACGYHFWPNTAPGGVNGLRFPVRLGLVSSVILLAALGIGTAFVVTAPGWGVMDTELMLIGHLVLAGFALGVGLLAQAILWRRLRTRGPNVKYQRAVLMVPVVVFSLGWPALAWHDRVVLLREYDPLVWAPRILARVQLAPLPESARDVRVYIYRVFLAGQDFLRFEADPNDIERFLADSTGPARIEPASLYDGEPNQNDIERLVADSSGVNDISPLLANVGKKRTRTVDYHKSSAPSWYDQPISSRTRRYHLNAPGGIGEMFIDDEKHAVYVYWGK